MGIAQGTRRSRWLRAGSAVGALASLFAISQASTTRADHLDDFIPVEPSCRYAELGPPGPAGNVLEVGLGNYQDLELERVGERIRVNQIDDDLHREIRCEGGNATVTNIDGITLLHPPVSEDGGYYEEFDDFDDYFFGSDLELNLDLQDGLLAPGATPETDGSEIEVTTDGPGLPVLELNLILTPAEDQVRIDTDRRRTLVNLNAGEATQDTDLELPPAPFGNVYAGDGDDGIIARTKIRVETRFAFFGIGLGVFGEGGADTIKAEQASGGDGADRLVGGPLANVLIGGLGNDIVRGKNESDLLLSAGGRDRLLAGGGRDGVISADRNGDRAYCGDGRDIAYVDRRDKRGGCERVKTVSGVVFDDSFFSPYKSRLRTRSGKRIP